MKSEKQEKPLLERMKNKKYIFDKNDEWGSYKEVLLTQKELDQARKKAKALLKKSKGDAISMRSCWICNGAHAHFLSGDWEDWILMCFDCGKFYFDGIDVTIYDEEGKEGKTK